MKILINRSGRQFAVLVILIITAGGGLGACSSGRSNSAENNSAATPVSASGSGVGDNKNGDQSALDAEKEKLRKDREQLEKEKQNLKDEKVKTERLKGAEAPASEITNTVSTLDPPSNIRDSPNGKILCAVKKEATLIKLYGSTGITDNNGEWFYTKHCGKMGVIHSSQFVTPG